MSESYRAVLRVPGAGRLLVSLSAAWLSFGSVGLVVLLAAHRQTGSYTAAGVTVAAFSFGAGAFAPLRGRLVDRRGGAVLPLFAGGYALALLGLGALAQERASAWTAVVVAAAAGCSAPPLVASVRAAWSTLIDPALVRRAYGLTSLLADAGVVVAPALGGVLFTWSAWSALAVCAGSALVAAGLAAPLVRLTDTGVRPPRIPGAASELRIVLALSVALGASLGLVEVAVPLQASRFGAATYSGFLLGSFALGSVAGALWSGRRSWPGRPVDRYLWSALAIGLLMAPVAAASSPAGLAPLLVLAGIGYGPATVALFEALDVLAPTRAVEALTWVTTAEAIGTAGGAAGAGALGQHIAGWTPFVVASALLAIPAALALAARRS